MFSEKDLLSFEFFRYGGVFTGSFENLKVRYRIARAGEKPDFTLKAFIWRGPEAFNIVSVRAPETVTEESFAYSEEGRRDAAEWIGKQYELLRRETPGREKEDS